VTVTATPTATSTVDTTDIGESRRQRHRLLGAWEATGRNDLRTHLAHFEPLPPTGGDFAERFLAALERAGLTGRGGAGFPAAVKLRSRRPSSLSAFRVGGRTSGPARSPFAAGRAVLVVNAMEGEPASMKDRVLLSCAPHLVIDGAQLAAVAVGARRVVVCVPDDRHDVASGVLRALAERRATRHTLVPVDVARPPGRFVAGEESALVGWLSRGNGAPAFRLDRSAPLTLAGGPAVVHNAETLAHMALIARWPETGMPQAIGGRAEDALEGREPICATTLVTISGAVRRPGVYEVELGARLADVVAMAEPAGRTAALVGGFAGTWVDGSDFDVPYSRPGLARLGATPGAGVVMVLGPAACGLAETARIAAYMAGESAGQCGPCVFGLASIADDLRELATGRGGRALLARISRRAESVTGRGACRHPDGVVRMVRSALRVFGADAAAHASGRPCRGTFLPSALPPGLRMSGNAR